MKAARQLLHIVVAVLAWVVFGLMWYWAFRNSGPAANQIESLLLVVVLALLVVATTGLWVAYNVGLWRRGDRREHPPVSAHDYSSDSAARRVDADFELLRASRYIEIDVERSDEGETKRYSAPEARQNPSDEEAASCVA